METQQVAEFVCRTEFGQIPSDVTEIAQNLVLDYLGVTIAGSPEPVSQLISQYAAGIKATPRVTVIGQGFLTEPGLAALANGTSGHALDYDDYTLETMGHPTVAILPSALSLGEYLESSGKDILLAYILGFEVASKIGSEVAFRHYQNGWHCTGTLCSLGAATAAGKLLKLDSSQMRCALGIAASLAGGLRENFGTMTKPLHAGRAAQNGVVAATLAGKGFTASDHILEADMGFNKVFAGGQTIDTSGKKDALGSPFSIISPGVTLKPYPSCGMTHCGIEAAVQLHNQYHISPAEIASVELTTHPMVPTVVFHHQPKTGAEARFSLEYCVSQALIKGDLSMKDYFTETVLEKPVQELTGKVKYGVYTKDEPYGPAATVKVTTKNGKVYTKRIQIPKGAPENPMSKEELHKKFRGCVSVALNSSDAEKVIEMVSDFNRLPDITGLVKLLKGKRK